MMVIEKLIADIEQWQIKTVERDCSEEDEKPYMMRLDSGEDRSICVRDPIFILRARGLKLWLTTANGSVAIEGDVFASIDRILRALDRCCSEGATEDLSLFGYFSYEAGAYFEGIPVGATDPYGLPDIVLFCPACIDHVHTNGRMTRMTVQRCGEAVKETKAYVAPIALDAAAEVAPDVFSVITKEHYMHAIAQIKEWISCGEIYQANYTQLLWAQRDVKGEQLYHDLLRRNPAQYFAYLRLPEAEIISTSPECFLQQVGRSITAEPIKGTVPRGADPISDAENKRRLCASLKDAAELAMIVDLFRNDFNRICQTGTVTVEMHRNLQSYTNVHHLVSRVCGQLRDDVSTIDVLRATFPSGSITGCPKIRSMILLNQLENRRRSVYTGAIGYVSARKINLNVAIRTLVKRDTTLLFQVGGGIVFDSDAASEYDETLAKARTFLDAVT